MTNCDCFVLYADEFNAVVKPQVVAAVREHTSSSLAFRIRVRTYCVNMFESEAERAAIEKVVRTLPADPNKQPLNQRKNGQNRVQQLIQGVQFSLSGKEAGVGQGKASDDAAGVGAGASSGNTPLQPPPHRDAAMDAHFERRVAMNESKTAEIIKTVDELAHRVRCLRNEARASAVVRANNEAKVKAILALLTSTKSVYHAERDGAGGLAEKASRTDGRANAPR
jgi:hypothetical protein